MEGENYGQIIVLNGVPRAGKSSLVAALMERFDEPSLNLGVDHFNNHITAKKYSPGLGLRPGGERPDLEPWIVRFFAALYDSIAAHSRQGLHVLTDIDHHDDYSQPRGILPDCARRLAGLPALLVGVRCPIEVVWERRRNTWLKDQDIPPDTPPPEILYRWEAAVHQPGIYDLEVDTSTMGPDEGADRILRRLQEGPAPTAFQQLADL